MDGDLRALVAHGVSMLATGVLLASLAGGGLLGLLLRPLIGIAVLLSLAASWGLGMLASRFESADRAEPRLQGWGVAYPVALNSMLFMSLLQGTYSQLALLGASLVGMLVLVRPRLSRPSATAVYRGVIGGFAAFVAVLLLSYILGSLGLSAGLAEVSLSISGGLGSAEVYGWYMLAVVAIAEEAWRFATLLVTGSRGDWGTAVAVSFAWFIWMHAPSRFAAVGPLAFVVLALIGLAAVIIWYFTRSFWGMVVGHAVYNTLLAGVYYGTLLVDVVLLFALVYSIYGLSVPRIEVGAGGPEE